MATCKQCPRRSVTSRRNHLCLRHNIGNMSKTVHPRDFLNEIGFNLEIQAKRGDIHGHVRGRLLNNGDHERLENRNDPVHPSGHAKELVHACEVQFDLTGFPFAGIDIHHACGHRGTCQLLHQLRGAIAGPIHSLNIHTTFKTMRRLCREREC